MITDEATGYDEIALATGLAQVGRADLVRFAAGCAERLFPTYQLAWRRTGLGDPAEVRRVLDLAWTSADADAPDDITELNGVLEDLVPEDDEPGWSEWSPLAQNAVAAAAYTLRAWHGGDPQDGVWAARQLYEAADHLVQTGAPTHEYVQPAMKYPPFAIAVTGILTSATEAGERSTDELRRAAEDDGQRFAALLRDPDDDD